MLNFGLTDLRLVSPRDGWPNPSAGPAASGADIVLEQAKLFDSVAEAVADVPRRKVVFLEWTDPLFCGGHWVPEMVAMAGGDDPLGRGADDKRRRDRSEGQLEDDEGEFGNVDALAEGLDDRVGPHAGQEGFAQAADEGRQRPRLFGGRRRAFAPTDQISAGAVVAGPVAAANALDEARPGGQFGDQGAGREVDPGFHHLRGDDEGAEGYAAGDVLDGDKPIEAALAELKKKVTVVAPPIKQVR